MLITHYTDPIRNIKKEVINNEISICYFVNGYNCAVCEEEQVEIEKYESMLKSWQGEAENLQKQLASDREVVDRIRAAAKK
jgi:hypothetical protein